MWVGWREDASFLSKETVSFSRFFLASCLQYVGVTAAAACFQGVFFEHVKRMAEAE